MHTVHNRKSVMHNFCWNKFSVLSVEVSQVKSEKLLKAKITKEGIEGSHRADVMSRKDHHLDRAVIINQIKN